MSDADLANVVKATLLNIEVPGGGRLGAFPGLSEIIVTKSAIAFSISVEPGMEGAFGPARAAAEEAVQKVAEGRKVLVSLTADAKPKQEDTGAPDQAKKAIDNRTPVPGIRHIVAVGSGKGGVGKSTTSVNLALALSARGLRVGVLDADLYGPSIPKLMGIEGQRPNIRDDDTFVPFKALGLEVISIGSMLEKDQPIVWRGPMATSAVSQLLRETHWGELDVLIIDLPPGTGDIQISLVQQVSLSGAVIVSTPQDLALIDARKALNLFLGLDFTIYGIVENMSYFVAPDTGNRYDIFGHGGAQRSAQELGVNFLGEVPLHMSIRETSDSGKPVVASDPEGVEAQAYLAIADKMLENYPDLKP